MLLVSPADAPDMRQVSGASAVAAATPNRLMDSISVPVDSPSLGRLNSRLRRFVPERGRLPWDLDRGLGVCIARSGWGADDGARRQCDIIRSLRVSVAHFLNDSVSLVCTAHPITTQKPTMLGDWPK